MVRFLNCNYPNGVCIPPGKPKELKKVSLELKKGNISLLVEGENKIWFKEKLGNKSYYMGIEFDIKKTFGAVQEFETIGAVNLALLDWCEEELCNDKYDLFVKYLRTL